MLHPAVASATGATAAACVPTGPGIPTGAIAVTPGARTIYSADTHGTTITAHSRKGLVRGRSIEVGGAPVAIAISPDGHLALVTTAAHDRPGLAIVDLRTGEVDRVDAGAAPRAVAFAPDGRSAYVAGGEHDGTLTRVDPRTRVVHAPLEIGADPHGLAILPGGKHALVALNGDARLVLVALGAKHAVKAIATRAFPHELAVSRDGRRALVTHNGFADRVVSLVDLEHRRVLRRLTVGAGPAGVAFSRSGTRALVACTGAGIVSVLDPRSGRRRKARVGGVPRAVAVAGSTGIVADARSGLLRAVSLGALR